MRPAQDSITELCNRPFAEHIIELHGFNKEQARQLLQHIQGLGHSSPLTMEHASFISACAFISEDQDKDKEGEEEEEEEEEDEEDEEDKENQVYDKDEFPKDCHFDNDGDSDNRGFQEHLLVCDMDPSREVDKEDIFSSAPSTCPSTLSETLCQIGAEITPTESELTWSNYSKDVNKDEEENEEDFISDVEGEEEDPSGNEKTKRGKYPYALRDILRHEGNCYFMAVKAISVWWGASVSTVQHLALISPKQTRDAGNHWNMFQTWHRLVDPVRLDESGKSFDVLI